MRDHYFLKPMVALTANMLLEGNIIDILGLQNIPEQRKTELLTRMTEVIQDRVSDRIVETLSADSQKEFDRLLNTNASEDMLDDFIKKNLPEFPQIVAEEVLRFKKQMADDVATVRKIVTAS